MCIRDSTRSGHKYFGATGLGMSSCDTIFSEGTYVYALRPFDAMNHLAKRGSPTCALADQVIADLIPAR